MSDSDARSAPRESDSVRLFDNFREAGLEAAKAARMMGEIAAHLKLWMREFEAGKLGVQITPDSRALSWLFRKIIGNLPKVTVNLIHTNQAES